ncbi:MAG: heme o synthase, partial [Candidatus Omnitrophota bacterium]|nr:heme o synthase [Candidatus Omnitrophota bacterium]
MKNSKSLFSAYLELTKPRILSLVLVTTALGFFLGGKGVFSWGTLIYLLIGASGVCAGSGVLNQYLERDVDCLMLRTQKRPLPTGIISPSEALSFGIILILAGLIVLCLKVNLLTAFLGILTAFLYVLVYTPLKKISWLNTTIGSIPGAIPPMGGWAAATNNLDLGAWVLFFILFLWQHPHFYAIAWMCKEDYKRAGFKMLPVVDPDGISTFRQIIIYSLILIPVSLVPSFIGISGKIY